VIADNAKDLMSGMAFDVTHEQDQEIDLLASVV